MNDASAGSHAPLSATAQAVLRHIAETRHAAHGRLKDFLRIPSVSAQANHAPDCRMAAEWAMRDLQSIGFSVGLCETPGQPIVLAEHPGPARTDVPHLLYYGHYDVQPAEPLELWSSPPFEPVVREGRNGPRIIARGAVDDKGQVNMWLEALRAWHAIAGGQPVRVTIVLEGEEEVGSVNLDSFLEAHRTKLCAANVAVVSDTGMWDADTPAITTRLRGLLYTEIRLHGATRDLHSGLFGGLALNPINALTRILGALHDDTGRVTLPGFYDDVEPLSAEQAEQWDALGFDESAFLADIGLSAASGERGVPALHRLWAQPTADINGIWGGYQGMGAKTVIAAVAGAKLSFRLVPRQDPATILALFKAWLAARTPPGGRIDVDMLSSAPGFEVAGDSRWVHTARQILAEEYGREAVLIGSGGSIPVVESFRRILGLDTLLMGFGLADDQVHSPNEKFDIKCLDHGTYAHARLLAALGQ